MNTELWNILGDLKSDKYKWTDLSYLVNEETHHYAGFNDLKINEILKFDKDNVSAKEFTMISQYGTHIDPPGHFVEGGRLLHEIGIEETAYPLCVVDVSDKVAQDNDYAITVEDLKEWEEKYGTIPRGCFVAMRSDWYKREGETFFNKDENGDCHYPGWSLEALKFLCEERHIAAIGHEPPDTDPAITTKTALWAGELYYLKQDKYQVEMLVNLDKLPPKGAIIFCGFPSIENAPGFTARCFAISPK